MVQKRDRMASISRMLRREREPGMYGDEELAFQMNSIEDAKTALDNCTFVLNNCKKLLDEAEEVQQKQ